MLQNARVTAFIIVSELLRENNRDGEGRGGVTPNPDIWVKEGAMKSRGEPKLLNLRIKNMSI